MNIQQSPIDLETEADHVSSYNNTGRRQRHTLSDERHFWFIVFYLRFVIMFLISFFILAFTYPLKPVLYVERFYVPAFDKLSPNITKEMKDMAFFELWFENRNKLISVSYDDFLNVTIHYLPNSTTSIYFANLTLPGFNQIKTIPFSISVQTPAPGMPGLLKLQKEFSTMVFRVDVGFTMRFHCRELGKHQHQFLMTAFVEVLLETGSSFWASYQMSEDSSSS